MSEQKPNVIYLKDYQAPPFWIDAVDLHFDLFEEYAVVTAVSQCRRNHDAQNNQSLLLDGNELDLLSVTLDGSVLSESAYRLEDEKLILNDVPDIFQLEIKTRIKPQENTALEGLYKSSGMFCTQCEAEGFRRITYFPDRPDVMAKYTTTIEANKIRYPVLLSNGNLVEQGEKENDRHWAKWSDPFPKPSYLFALVAGDLLHKEDKFVTSSGREVTLRIFVEHTNIDKCDHALTSLKKAMRWDEEAYGREYDLDVFMIVAVNDFNMGAMENKGLNIFNSACVLAKPETATDADYDNIEGIIGHEYFHNWSGNRVTCRDWFQLSLKEGFTVFRDQEFSADMGSRAVKRISEVNILRTAQFSEDAGPMAHPVRPDSYIDISNFYTVTIYNKGAEVVRMIHTILGDDRFRKGCDLYFSRHDGQAVTTEDFVKAMEDANEVDLRQFRLWYTQAGTPVINVAREYDADKKQYRLTLTQSCPSTPNQENKEPFHIPVALGLLDESGNDMRVTLQNTEADNFVVDLNEQKQSFVFEKVPNTPTPSLLRGFSAPVKLEVDYSEAELMFLMANDNDEFNRWEAGQRLAVRTIHGLMEQIRQGQSLTLSGDVIEAYRSLLESTDVDAALIAQAMSLPNERYLAELESVIEPDVIHQARNFVVQELAKGLKDNLLAIYERNGFKGPYAFNAEHMARRSLKNTCLNYLTSLQEERMYDLSMHQYEQANNMTDKMAAMSSLMDTDSAQKQEVLTDFYQQWKHDPLVVNKWLGLQSRADVPSVLDNVKQLMQHEAFEIKNPNKVRALIGGFCMGNVPHFHSASGEGYEFLADQVLMLNKLNPQMAARMAGGLSQWRRYESKRSALMQAQLQRIAASPDLSKDVYEIVTKSLQH